jgi:ParB-like chromosome segregation protein Spo0J
MITEAKPEKIHGYEVHALAANFPLLEGPEFDELVESIKRDGQRKPIKKSHDDLIVDGRNRLRACMKAGVEPQFVQLNEHDDILNIIIQENVLRRHLTVSQRAMLAADLTGATVGRPRKDESKVSSNTAAEKMNVSRSSVAKAKAVKESGVEELQTAVRSGVIDVKPAAEIARKPAAEQVAAVQEIKAAGKTSRAKPTAAQFSRDKWRAKYEIAHSKLMAEAPPDMQDWCRGASRDVTGGSLRKEANLNIPDGDDVALYDIDDVITRIECMLKEIPVGERKGIKLGIGKHFSGEKPEQYLPGLPDDDADKLKLVSSEIKHRAGELESLPDAAKILKKAANEVRKLAKGDDSAE